MIKMLAPAGTFPSMHGVGCCAFGSFASGLNLEFGSFPFGTEGGAEGTKVAVGMLLSSGAFLFLEAKKSVSFASGAGPDDRVIFLFYAPRWIFVSAPI